MASSIPELRFEGFFLLEADPSLVVAAETSNHRPEQHERRPLSGNLHPQIRLYRADGTKISDCADADAAEQPPALLAEAAVLAVEAKTP